MTEMKKIAFRALIFALATFAATVLIALKTIELSRNRAVAAAFAAGNRAGERNAVGYPASVSELEDNATYWVSASIIEERRGHTNKLAVLQKVAGGAGIRFRQIAPNRLFELPEALSRGRYYRAFIVPIGGKTNVDFVEVPPPAPSP